MIKLAIPLLHISKTATAEEFYCRRLGFNREFVHRADPAKPDPAYMGVQRDGIWMHLSSFSGDGVPGHAVNLLVEDVDALYAEFLAKDVRIDLVPTDQTWGTREMYVRDPDNNCIRFIRE